MFVIKRDGRQEPVHFDKITARITKLSYGLNPEFCDPVRSQFSRHKPPKRCCWAVQPADISAFQTHWQDAVSLEGVNLV